jgi:UMF1 family MFS transporter
MKFTTQQTITLILVVNITAAIGAFGFGYLQDAIGHIKAVALTLVGWIVMVVLAGLSDTATMFWLAANLAGLCMGSSQAAGRAIVGYLAPPTRLASSSACGPRRESRIDLRPYHVRCGDLAFPGNHRLRIFVTGIYFVIGLLLLKTIDVERGRRAALQ